MSLSFLLFDTLKAKEDELRGCKERRSFIEKEVLELRFAIAKGSDNWWTLKISWMRGSISGTRDGENSASKFGQQSERLSWIWLVKYWVWAPHCVILSINMLVCLALIQIFSSALYFQLPLGLILLFELEIKFFIQRR